MKIRRQPNEAAALIFYLLAAALLCAATLPESPPMPPEPVKVQSPKGAEQFNGVQMAVAPTGYTNQVFIFRLSGWGKIEASTNLSDWHEFVNDTNIYSDIIGYDERTNEALFFRGTNLNLTREP
jgi:hypothetical protein